MPGECEPASRPFPDAQVPRPQPPSRSFAWLATQAVFVPRRFGWHTDSLRGLLRKLHHRRLPTPGAPLGEVRALGAECRVLAVPGVDPRLVGEPVEELRLDVVEERREVFR